MSLPAASHPRKGMTFPVPLVNNTVWESMGHSVEILKERDENLTSKVSSSQHRQLIYETGRNYLPENKYTNKNSGRVSGKKTPCLKTECILASVTLG